MTAVWTIAGYGLREALRRKVFVVVCFLTAAFLSLYWLGVRYAFHHVAGVEPPAGVDPRTFAGAFLFGMAMFGTLFLGVVLAIFLTLGTVRGDAERDATPAARRSSDRPNDVARCSLSRGRGRMCAVRPDPLLRGDAAHRSRRLVVARPDRHAGARARRRCGDRRRVVACSVRSFSARSRTGSRSS